MSNALCAVMYGCELSQGRYDQDPETQAVRDLCKDSSVYSRDAVGWHETYDSRQDLLWFGVAVGGVCNGFSAIPEISEYLRAEVREEWEKLDEGVREILGEPKLQMMVWMD